MWNNRSSHGGYFTTVPIYTNVPTTPEFDKLNAFVFEKFSVNEKSSDIELVIKKYVSEDFFDRSGRNINSLYNHFTINRPLQNDKEYFTKNITPLLSSIFEAASLFKESWGVHSDQLQRYKDETNRRCKMLLDDLMSMIEEHQKLKKEKVSKKKKKPISATIKKLVWNTHIGEEIGKSKCLCCNVTDITQMSFNCGHVIAEANGGDTIVSNLKPICQNCNSSMGTKNMNDFMNSLK
jgi:hypothetical protein